MSQAKRCVTRLIANSRAVVCELAAPLAITSNLAQRFSTPFVAAHSRDAERLGLTEGEAVRLISRRGFARTTLKVDDSITPGTLFMPFHWGQSFSKDGCVNATTTGDSDPISLQPELKFSAVRLEKDA